MDYNDFVEQQIQEIKETVGSGIAVNALSGGVDSAVVTALAHQALGKQLKTFFVDNGLMRKGEPELVKKAFDDLSIPITVIDARDEFLGALRGIKDPEEKRQAITDTFYSKLFRRVVQESGAQFLFQGTILTDIEETVAGIKRQHNILSQLGIDSQKEYGYTVLEPLKTLRKDGVRKVGEMLGLPTRLTRRIPFPGPALAARIIGEVTANDLEIVREATAVVEEELDSSGAFQYMAVLFKDRATGIRNNRREFGRIIAVRCIESVDARTAEPSRLPWETLQRICDRVTNIPQVNRCLYDLTPKPPATVEYI